jgi:hypothetical protein
MGEIIKLNVKKQPVFIDMTDMLNTWWKEQERKPLAKPVRIRHVVEMAHAAGWTLNECYDALSLTWAFTEPAFETALRRIKDEEKAEGSVSNVAHIDETRKAMEIMKKESLSMEENAKRMRELRDKFKG